MSDDDELAFTAAVHDSPDDEEDVPFKIASSAKKAKKVEIGKGKKSPKKKEAAGEKSKESKSQKKDEVSKKRKKTASDDDPKSKPKKKPKTVNLDEDDGTKSKKRKNEDTGDDSSKKKKTTKKTENLEKPKKKKDKDKKKEEQEKYAKYYNAGDYSKYPLYASTVCGANIKKVIEIIAPLTPDAVLRFAPDGLSIFGMEQVRMAILSIHFEKELFHPYKCDEVFEIGIDTQHLSRVLQHVPKYDSLTFYIPDKDDRHTLGIITVNGKTRAFNITTVTGNETSEMEDIQIPPKEFGGFLEFSAPDFQRSIHELFQTATVVTFATNMKDFRMITRGTANGGPFSPRQLIFYPSTDGVRFMENNPFFKKKDSEQEDEDEESIFKAANSEQKEDPPADDDDEECPFVAIDTPKVGVRDKEDKDENAESEDSDNEDPSENEEDDKCKPINIAKMLEDANRKLDDSYIQATYMLKYINSFTKATQLAKNVAVLFQRDGPAIFHYKMEKGVITYCLSDISSAAEQNR